VSHTILVAWGQTDWEAQGRLTGDLDLSLSAAGEAQVGRDASELLVFGPAQVFSGPEEAARRTAAVIARGLHVRPRRHKDLHEIDLGHWEGLTPEHFEDRYPSVWRQWQDDPTSVNPPEGEPLVEAAARLGRALARIVRKAGDENAIIVTGPLAMHVLWLIVEGRPLATLWERTAKARRWIALERPAPPATPA